MAVIQIPADGVGKRVDTVTLTDEAVEVHRQKIVLTGGSGTAEVVVVTNANPAAGDMGLVVRLAGTASIALAGGTANIGTVNNISATVQVALSTPFTVNNISAPVVLAAGSANIGSINNISATVLAACTGTFNLSGTAVVAGSVAIAAGSANIGSINNISATVSVAGNVNISTMPAVALAAGAANIGSINNISATVTVAGNINISATHSVILAAGTANFGTLNNISATVTVSGNVNISATPSVILAAGTANFGTLNDISRTVQVAIGTPFILQGISTTVQVAIATPFILQGISTTVQVAIATPFTVNNISATVQAAVKSHFTNLSVQSASRGPKMSIVSTSAAVTLVVAPGAGMAIYVTSIACANGGAAGSRARVGTSGSPQSVVMFMASAGGGFVMPFSMKPWKLSTNEALIGSVKPNTSEANFNIDFFVASADAL